MMRFLAVVALALVTTVSWAQPDDAPVHTFQVLDGQVYLDGRLLPDAIPAGLDLSGQSTSPLEFSGPVTPVLEIDGRPYVLEGERLIPMEASSQAGQGVFLLDADAPAPSAVSREEMRPIIEAAYMRDVADRDRTLYDQMQREAALEATIVTLAGRVRALSMGPERQRLRSDLRRQLSDLLSLKHQIRAQEIALAQDRLDAARTGLERRRSLHDAIVDGRLRELVGDE